MSKERIEEKIGFINLDDLIQDKENKEKFIEISAKDASAIRDNYNRFFLTPRIVGQNGDRIRGFTFSRADLEMALYGKEQSNPDVDVDQEDQEIASEIHIAFGYHDGSVKAGVVGYTTIAYGVGQNGLIETKGRVRDYSRPCPPKSNCPQNAK
jgi:hypothetical protein